MIQINLIPSFNLQESKRQIQIKLCIAKVYTLLTILMLICIVVTIAHYIIMRLKIWFYKKCCL